MGVTGEAVLFAPAATHAKRALDLGDFILRHVKSAWSFENPGIGAMVLNIAGQWWLKIGAVVAQDWGSGGSRLGQWWLKKDSDGPNGAVMAQVWTVNKSRDAL
ncbi:hypothetical protein KOW79_018555 [Hemibagrus wyckioides]|uniref:Uncharacterized protein n=1 Tax=Hemibagrus wyckioides TaxID=337641 RepID=A0A9D3NAH8_9TELE|nr:hypothetical protein KOW79_018555 [Hemibagrus wyckioides]